MKIAFHTNQLSLRGTEIAMYDYANHNELLLGNKSIIVTKHPEIQPFTDPLAVEKFRKRFSVRFYKTTTEFQNILEEENCNVLYALKAGMRDEIVSESCKTVVHAVFQYNDRHGDVYAYVSEWLSDLYYNNHPYVPHMIDLPNVEGDLRAELGIPADAKVYGRYGGYETFDIPYVKDMVVQYASALSNVYFIFMNTERFTSKCENIIFLDGTADLIRKVRFINTCDAMLHARIKGESFGLAIAEFSIKNKPVITCTNSIDGAHIKMLGDKGNYYHDPESLFNQLNKPWDKTKDWNAFKEYTPENVMKKFKEVFL